MNIWLSGCQCKTRLKYLDFTASQDFRLTEKKFIVNEMEM